MELNFSHYDPLFGNDVIVLIIIFVMTSLILISSFSSYVRIQNGLKKLRKTIFLDESERKADVPYVKTTERQKSKYWKIKAILYEICKLRNMITSKDKSEGYDKQIAAIVIQVEKKYLFDKYKAQIGCFLAVLMGLLFIIHSFLAINAIYLRCYRIVNPKSLVVASLYHFRESALVVGFVVIVVIISIGTIISVKTMAKSLNIEMSYLKNKISDKDIKLAKLKV